MYEVIDSEIQPQSVWVIDLRDSNVFFELRK